ncbi:glycosyltransferase family 4 protein [Paenibacillus cremeus]|uniref:Glycosyltransferase family 4 protein n=1 Tax=Paenibacillus cremeus TaxID=2163881 RepID=A0A559K550_9BACL|nr:glycosyltransferase family 4 protein [Paenibacillus cremeus]TVY07220.1 glycosyltransferase family 4 protein [Paenibacillus cremeus]
MRAKKVLFTSTNAMAYHFLIPHVKSLIDEGYIVELACSNLDGYDELLRSRLIGAYKSTIHYVRLNRNPFKFSNIKGYFEMRKIISTGRYDLISTNEPVMGLVTRLAARNERKKGTKVSYTAHGFHFFKGAPFKNWILYYPIERFLARYTDIIITINKEDHNRALKFKINKIEQIPGIGIDTEKYSKVVIDKARKRRELGVTIDEAFVILSVGELNENKNHEVIIKAVAKLNNPYVFYVICGKGKLENYLKDLAKKLGVDQQVKLLGYRKDIDEICKSADIFAFPSKREGLGLAAIEAMATGLPIITSNVHGIVDYSTDGVTGYICNPTDVHSFAQAIERLLKNDELRINMGIQNMQIANKFRLEASIGKLKKIFGEVLSNE